MLRPLGMAGISPSLAKKLAIAGVFLISVVMAVGTEDDPGPVVTGQETVKDLRNTLPTDDHAQPN